MLRVFNSLGKRLEVFRPVRNRAATVFTCGPSLYQRAHIGNFRTFLFEDILVRYLEYLGHTVKQGMNITDIEDKALEEAEKRRIGVRVITDKNLTDFIDEMKLLGMRIPDYLPRASEAVEQSASIIDRLLEREIAYRYRGNIYFDPLKFPGFGKLYGLDMSKWPKKRRRFHKDTYPGVQWNLGDFILWHACRNGDTLCWDIEIGKGRPSWNVQDPSMISKYFDETLSVYCGGYDNLFRHHDYTLAILESVRPYPMAKYWLHCHHLMVDGKKMSKSKGNILYTDTLLNKGYDANEIRFFLIYGHYRKKLNYSSERMEQAANRLREFKGIVRAIRERTGEGAGEDGGKAQGLEAVFVEKMDNDLDVKGAFDGLYGLLSDLDGQQLKPQEASGIICVLRKIDEVLHVIF